MLWLLCNLEADRALLDKKFYGSNDAQREEAQVLVKAQALWSEIRRSSRNPVETNEVQAQLAKLILGSSYN